MNFLQTFGLLLSLYDTYGLVAGQIQTKDGNTDRYIMRAEEPMHFWVTCSCCIAVGIKIFFAVVQLFGQALLEFARWIARSYSISSWSSL